MIINKKLFIKAFKRMHNRYDYYLLRHETEKKQFNKIDKLSSAYWYNWRFDHYDMINEI